VTENDEQNLLLYIITRAFISGEALGDQCNIFEGYSLPQGTWNMSL